MRAVVASKGALKTATREATHLDADGASIESAGVPGIVGEVDHLRHFTAVLANDVVRRDLRSAHFEPSDGALVAALAIVQHYEVDARATAAREVGGWSPEKRRKKVRHLETHAVGACKGALRCGERMPLTTTAAQTEVVMNTSASRYVRVFTSSSRARR